MPREFTINSNNKNNQYQSELDMFSNNPRFQKMVAEHLKIYGSLDGIMKATYGSSSSNYSSSSSSSSDNLPSASSNGKYMTHCYYGYQPGNKITTVIG